jgi:hypothetical protein
MKTRESLLSGAVMMLIGGMAQIAVAANPVTYAGEAALCAVDAATVVPDLIGNGLVISNYQTQFYRIETSSELLNGWEALSLKTKVTKSGNAFNWGTALLKLDGYEGKNDALKDNFNILLEPGPPAISGTYEGTGELEGVTVQYYLTPYPISEYPDPVLVEMCSEDPPYCEDVDCDFSPTGMFAWSMSGVIYDER